VEGYDLLGDVGVTGEIVGGETVVVEEPTEGGGETVIEAGVEVLEGEKAVEVNGTTETEAVHDDDTAI
jgi:hypothetical protein